MTAGGRWSLALNAKLSGAVLVFAVVLAVTAYRDEPVLLQLLAQARYEQRNGDFVAYIIADCPAQDARQRLRGSGKWHDADDATMQGLGARPICRGNFPFAFLRTLTCAVETEPAAVHGIFAGLSMADGECIIWLDWPVHGRSR